MITTVTLNASIDKAYYMSDAIENGTVMRVREVRNVAGGKGLNVAKVAHICGEEIKVTGFVGGFNGQWLESMAANAGLITDFEHVSGETRSCVNILDPKFGSTEYLEPGFELSPEDIAKFMARFPEIIRESSVVTMSGSAPRGVAKNIYGELVRIIRETGKRVILDTSGEYLKLALLSEMKPNMIKPNKDEIEQITGIKPKTLDDVKGSAILLHETGVEFVVVSLGSEGALLACDDGVLIARPPKLEAVNTVGCGDAMTGAFAVAMSRNLRPDEALRYAVAVSAASALSPDTGDFAPKNFDGIFPNVKIF
mgnify:CR=1 FL=1